MGFLEKIEPFLETDDLTLQTFLVETLQDYPLVPEEWTVRLIKEAVSSKEKEINILTRIYKHRLNEEAVRLLIKGAKSADSRNRPLYLNLLYSIRPKEALKFRQELTPFFDKKKWSFYETLENGEEEEVWEQYGELLVQLETEERFSQEIFDQAKMTVEVLVEKGWIDDIEIAAILNQDLNEEYFSFAGILIFHAIGIMNQTKYIPLLANLLLRDEDLLVEAVSDTLIKFQSKEAVLAIVPYLENPDCLVFGTSILGNCKIPEAEAELVKLLPMIEHEDDQVLVVEGICFQLSGKRYPEMDAYLAARGSSSSMLVDLNMLAYGYYTLMGIEHPNLEGWKKNALERQDQSLQTTVEEMDKKKTGRNDPCPCGSGKKYKKCCGK